ncbi:MAG: hypothetical protein ACK4HV_01550 [Parachlamydiaceae bacterium]
MANTILSPYQGIDFTALCLSSEPDPSKKGTYLTMAVYLVAVGFFFGEVVYYYPDPVPVVISGSCAVTFFFVLGWIFYKHISEKTARLNDSAV